MTYQNDPNQEFRRPIDPVVQHRVVSESWGVGPIILASLAAIAIVFGLFYAIANQGDTATATRTDNRPAVTTAPMNSPPAARETTGSGPNANRPTEPTGSKPAVPTQAPAPASPNR